MLYIVCEDLEFVLRQALAKHFKSMSHILAYVLFRAYNWQVFESLLLT